MKNFVLFLVLFLASESIKSQVIVEDVNINELEDVTLCQVVARGKLFSNKVTITIDYGQKIKWASNKGTQVLDENGKKRKFNTVMDALNYMEHNGWKYIDANVITIDSGFGSQNVYHYYFRKEE